VALSVPSGCFENGKAEMSRNVERVLEQIGQSVRPMCEAPRDGRTILGQSASGFVVCHWDAKPERLAGPAWVQANEDERGWLDRCFSGWLDPARLKLWNYATLADLLRAFVDDAYEQGDTRALEILERRARAGHTAH
jgi:hypothetical protein